MISYADLERLESKIDDLIRYVKKSQSLNSDTQRAPAEIDKYVNGIVYKFEQRRSKREASHGINKASQKERTSCRREI